MTQISFEFFSPKTVTAAFSLSRAAETLAGFAPQFSSVTCSKDPAQTLDTLRALRRSGLGRLQAHVTCSTQQPADLPAYLKAAQEAGAEGLIALRGDTAPKGLDVMDLIACAKRNEMQDVFVAAYPEVHPLAQSSQSDLDWLKRKQDAGATAAITQFFFHVEFFLRFRDRAAAQGITLPIIPGILPVQNWTATQAIASRCGTSIAPDLAEGFARAEREGRAEMMAIAQASELCDSLIQNGVEHLHFYTMNKAEVVSAICTAMGKAPQQRLRRVA
ncbi:methylenetetrahydrofolate reductase [Planktomarina temperata]|nr:methylenetetrahydrofolate reductase [Planktomarina temperata]